MATEVFPAGDYLREELEARGWTQAHLARVLGRPVRLVNDLIHARRGITRKTAEGLATAFDTSPELWLNLEGACRRTPAGKAVGGVAKRAKLYARAPVREE
jgi:HTH-type transcriptional regulator/antitoxin HigA